MPGNVADAASSLQSCCSLTGFRHSRSRFRAVARGYNNPFRNMTTHCIGSDSYGAGTRESKSNTCFVAGRRLRHLAFLVIFLSRERTAKLCGALLCCFVYLSNQLFSPNILPEYTSACVKSKITQFLL